MLLVQVELALPAHAVLQHPALLSYRNRALPVRVLVLRVMQLPRSIQASKSLCVRYVQLLIGHINSRPH